ncbi:hypothetical protein Aau02nite_11480 [Amorphoplanes auranticolor]|uniref:Uncharacterized protein n=1 Tax=Actinoplanes auranticolor TaxID=47988 RepID=A0A919VPV8_9ACTN|nr:hypothetical protein Aau02nite_11480 [Actinoplanes auranticolor]
MRRKLAAAGPVTSDTCGRRYVRRSRHALAIVKRVAGKVDDRFPVTVRALSLRHAEPKQ